VAPLGVSLNSQFFLPYSSIKADIFEISVKYFLSERLTPDLPEKEGLTSDIP